MNWVYALPLTAILVGGAGLVVATLAMMGGDFDSIKGEFSNALAEPWLWSLVGVVYLTTVAFLNHKTEGLER